MNVQEEATKKIPSQSSLDLELPEEHKCNVSAREKEESYKHFLTGNFNENITALMTIFRYQEDRLPVLLIVLLFCADLAVYFTADSIFVLVLWLMLVTFPKVCICSWNHHHQHLPTYRFKVLNRILEVIYALHTGITTNAWVLHHNLGHHLNYLDQTKDESTWMRKDGSTMGEFEYTFVTAITGYVRAFKVGRKYPKYQTEFVGMGIVSFLLVCAALYYNWLNALFVFCIPMLFGYLVTVWHTYSHHAGLHTDDPLHASHNVLHRWYNICTGNLGFHTAHHMKPGLHWSKLPEYHRQIEDKIPSHLFVDPPIPFKWFLKRAA